MSAAPDFGGRIAVVTGGGNGIGEACCRELASRGARVVILDRELPAAERVAESVGGRGYACDVADDVALEEQADRIEREVGAVSVLVNCAGIVQGRLSPHEMPMRKWDDIVRIDQRGTYVACLAFAAPMLRRRQGVIVNVASTAGMRSMPLHAYGPAKAAVIAMTETLAAEWGAAGIRVNAVSPGFTLTARMRTALDTGMMDEAALRASSALHRLVEPGEVAQAVAFLASDQASAITGINLPVDCGWIAGSTWGAYGGLPTRAGG